MKASSGCLVAAAVLGVCAIGGVATCAFLLRTGARDANVDAKIAAEAASAQAQAASELEEDLP